jgi:hypothetical protein
VLGRESDNSISKLSEEDYRDYEFIVSDLEHNLALSPEQQLDRFRADPWNAFSGLKGPNGYDLPLSREALKRFECIATRGLKALGVATRIHRLKKVIEELKSELSSLLCRGFVPDINDAHELFTSAIDRLKAKYIAFTYHIPCSAAAERSYTSFEIGPVSFCLSDQFLKLNESAMRKAAELGDAHATEPWLSRATAFYSSFQWIASVTVPPCDPEVSRSRARDVIQRALDVFKFLVGSARASHVKQAYDLTTPDSYYEFYSRADGSFSLRSGGKTRDAILNDQWYDQVPRRPRLAAHTDPPGGLLERMGDS